MFRTSSVSLVFPAFNEEENIATAITDFSSLHIFDEIIVVDNNSKDKTAQLARRHGAKVVKEKRQGYGFALQKGITVAKGDYVVLAEPDGTFQARDVRKLLTTLNKYDAVVGSRTHAQFIGAGANMGSKLRLGNWCVAKLLQILFRTSSLTDCGCTLRAFKKSTLKAIAPRFTVGASHFLPETVILMSLSGFRFIEIPVHYRARVGTSKITGSLRRSCIVGCAMIELILSYWVKRFENKSAVIMDKADL